MARYFIYMDSLIAFLKIKSEAVNLASTCTKKMYWATEALKKKDTNGVKKYWEETRVATAPLLAADKYHQIPEVIKYLSDYNQLASTIENTIRSLQISDEIKSQTTTFNSKANWLKGSLDKKDVKNASKYAQELRQVFTPFVEKYGSEEEAQKILTDVNAILERFDKEAGGISVGNFFSGQTSIIHIFFLDDEVKELVAKLDSKAYWVTNSLGKNDPAQAMKYADEVRVMFQPMLDKYASVPSAQACITKIQEVLNRVDIEAGPMILEGERAADATKLDSQSYWVTNCLDKKDPDGAVKYAEELRKNFTPYLEKYGNLPTAKASIEKMQGILDRVDKEVVPLIEGKAMKTWSFFNYFRKGNSRRNQFYYLQITLGNRK
jgi:hypothetical protein